MKKNPKISHVFFAALLLFVAGSCRHLKEELENVPLPSQLKISKIIYEIVPDIYHDSSYNRTTYFNAKGDPEKTVVQRMFTGNSNQAYIYNKNGNLSQWISFLGDTPSSIYAEPQFNNIFNTHLYVHDLKGNIIADTLYLSNGNPVHKGALFYSVTTYKYDGFDRLIYSKEHHIPFDSNSYVEKHYTYEIDGNLTGYEYDSKPSFRRLSKALMFLMKDYSINNRVSSSHPESDSNENYQYEYGISNYPVKVTGPKFIPDEAGSNVGISTIYYK